MLRYLKFYMIVFLGKTKIVIFLFRLCLLSGHLVRGLFLVCPSEKDSDSVLSFC